MGEKNDILLLKDSKSVFVYKIDAFNFKAEKVKSVEFTDILKSFKLEDKTDLYEFKFVQVKEENKCVVCCVVLEREHVNIEGFYSLMVSN